jgi:hypothetical protein
MQHKLIEVSSAEFASDLGRYLQEAALGTTVSVTAPSGSFVIVSVPTNRTTAEVVNFADFVRHQEEAGDTVGRHRGSEGILAVVRSFGPLQEDFPEIPRPMPEPFDL